MNVVSFTNKGSVKFQSEEIVERAYACLECHPHFRGRTIHIHVCCSESALTLQGRLPSYYLKQLLQAALREVSEDRIIHNDVEVFNPSDPLILSIKEREKTNVQNEIQEE